MKDLKDRLAYRERVRWQGQLWCEGVSAHNIIDDECCPDFSCCIPSLFIKDTEYRQATHRKWLKANGLLS